MHKNELKSEAKYNTMNMNPNSIIPVSLKSLKLEILTYIYGALVLKFFKLNELLLKQLKKQNDRKFLKIEVSWMLFYQFTIKCFQRNDVENFFLSRIVPFCNFSILHFPSILVFG